MLGSNFLKIGVWVVAAVVLAIGLAAGSFGQAGQGGLAGRERADYEPPQVLAAAEPVYPWNAVNPGTVVLEVSLDAAGKIEQVRVVQAAAGFTDEAQRAIQKWKFKAARLNGEPVPSVIPVAFSFSQPAIWQQPSKTR
ncbi:MAG: energy transducer TonB [Acidobacteria bacterium]|nr:energy transducer TonB [Acidobacteriota bacterium]